MYVSLSRDLARSFFRIFSIYPLSIQWV